MTETLPLDDDGIWVVTIDNVDNWTDGIYSVSCWTTEVSDDIQISPTCDGTYEVLPQPVVCLDIVIDPTTVTEGDGVVAVAVTCNPDGTLLPDQSYA